MTAVFAEATPPSPPVQESGGGEPPDKPESEVRQVIGEFVEITNIQVSEEVTLFAELLVRSIRTDPHPSWQLDAEDISPRAHAIVRNMPERLQSIASEGKIGPNDTITLFHVLHWIDLEGLERICPIQKQGTERSSLP